ncbi:MAG: cobalamin-binding protein [Bacteroidetes bacterium]|nr:cobalamin-binding protein [Bacteroidota bacterium]MBU1421746.1 cobalamin-binding protein [Bacteroidota bacterium]MBU2471468.1 cobalamin-binding protein [Bacteroidota bacterium]
MARQTDFKFQILNLNIFCNWFLIFICALGFVLWNFYGCQSKNSDINPKYLKITDDLGRDVVLDKKPSRIISLAPNITEILFALDSGKTLAAVTDYCDYPEQAKTKPRIGGMINPNYEIITELNPDLIIMTVEGNNQNDFDKLEKLGYKIFVTRPKNIEGILKSVTDIGKIIEVDERSAALVNQLHERQAAILQSVRNTSPPKVFIIISLQPLISAAEGTFIDEMINLLGGINIAAESVVQYPIINREAVLKQNPDVVIAMDDAVKNKDEMLKYFPEWKKLKAFKHDKVFVVDGDLLSRPGPRIIDGLEVLAGLVNESRKVFK